MNDNKLLGRKLQFGDLEQMNELKRIEKELKNRLVTVYLKKVTYGTAQKLYRVFKDKISKTDKRAVFTARMGRITYGKTQIDDFMTQ